MKVASFFSGCGGLDLGFEQAGIEVIWANDIEASIHETYQFYANQIFGNYMPPTFLIVTDLSEVPLANHGVKEGNNLA